MDNKAAALLKVRFGAFEHMQKHLHVVDGRTLFFFRDPRIGLAGGQRVLIEFSFGGSEQAATLRGSVVGRVDGEGGQAGAWIEFPDAKLARRLDQGPGSITARHQKRLGCDMLVQLKLDDLPLLGRMVDASLGGARVIGLPGLRAADEVEMRIMGAEEPLPAALGRALVVRSESGGDIGVRFIRTDSTARIASSKLYSAVQQGWARAPEIAHSPQCCMGGTMLEPPLPRMKNRV